MGTLLLIPLLILIFFGLFIDFCILLSGTVFLQVTSLEPLLVVAQELALELGSSSLLVIPLLTLMGYIMENYGLSRRLINRVYSLFGEFRGAIGLVTIICCTISAALSGSGPATVAAVGSILISAMIGNDYPSKTAARLTAMAGALGPIIPPNIVMIVYGTAMRISITKMFMGGIVPRILITICLAVADTIKTRKLPLKVNLERHSLKEQLLATQKALPMLLSPVIILGEIYGGIFTPTKSTTVGVVYSFVLALVYHKVTVKSFINSAKKTVETSAMIYLLIARASVFCWILSATQIPAKITSFVISMLGGSQALYRILLLIVLLFTGCLIENLASVVVLALVLVPIGLAMGINEIHLGVVFCISLIVGFVTPPFGANLFTMVGITKQPFGEMVVGVLLFLAIPFITLIPCIIFPPIVTFLPPLLPT